MKLPARPALPAPAAALATVREIASYLRRQGDDPFEGATLVEVDTTRTPGRAQARDAYVRERLGDQLPDILAGRLVALPRDDTRFPAWSLHCCVLDAECRKFDAPARLHLTMPWWLLTLGLLPGTGITPGPAAHRLGPVVVEPRREDLCENVVALARNGELLETMRTCPLRRGHRGGCLDWKHDVRVDRPTIEEAA